MSKTFEDLYNYPSKDADYMIDIDGYERVMRVHLPLRIIWLCGQHEHRYRLTAWLCGRWQWFKIQKLNIRR